jgi:hypothetical protein
MKIPKPISGILATLRMDGRYAHRVPLKLDALLDVDCAMLPSQHG